MPAGSDDGGSQERALQAQPSSHMHAQLLVQQEMPAPSEYDLVSISPADLLAAAQQHNASRNIHNPVAAILLGIPERAQLHETAIRVHPFTLPLPADVKPNAYVRPWKMIVKRAAAIAAVDIIPQSAGSTQLPASSSIASKVLAAGGLRAKQAAVDAAAALLKSSLHSTVVATAAGHAVSDSVEHQASLADTAGLGVSSAQDLDTLMQQQGSNGGQAQAITTLLRKAPAMYGVLPPDQIRFHAALAGFLGMVGTKLDMPLLAPNAPLLDLRRLFLEVIEQGGCSSVYGSHAWPELAKLLQRDESLGPLLGDVYRWLLLPVEAALPLEIRPARVLEWLEGRAKARSERTEPLPSPVAVLAALNTAEQGIHQWDQHHPTRLEPSSSNNGSSMITEPSTQHNLTVTRDVHGRSMAAATQALLLQMAARPLQVMKSMAQSAGEAVAAEYGQGHVSFEQSPPDIKIPRKRAGKALKGAGKRKKPGPEAADGPVLSGDYSGFQEPRDSLLPDPELSSPLDLAFSIHDLKSDLMAELMAIDANLPLGFSSSFDSNPENVMANRAVSYVSQDMGGAPPFAKQTQTGRVSMGNQPPKARNGASPAVKRHLAATTAQDPGMVRRADRVVGGQRLRWAVYTTRHNIRQGFQKLSSCYHPTATEKVCPLFQSVDPSLDDVVESPVPDSFKHIN